MTFEPVPTVSVCVATYNQDRYIQDCLTSVLAQLGDLSLEILVGDDGAGEETPRIVQQLMQRYPGVISYHKHPKNLGPAANYQYLIARARGKYIAHLDGDDFWLAGKLGVQVGWMESHPDSPACYANAFVVDAAGDAVGMFSSRIDQPVDMDFLLQKGNFLNHSSMLYRASHRNIVLDLQGPFIDYRLHLGFARLGHLGFSNRALVVYRVGSEHSMIRTMPQTVYDLYFEALNSVLLNGGVSVTTRRAALAHFWSNIVLQAMLRFDFGYVRLWSGRFKTSYPKDYVRVMTKGGGLACWRIGRALVKRAGSLFCTTSGLKVLHVR